MAADPRVGTLGQLGLQMVKILKERGEVALRVVQDRVGDWTPRGVEAVDAGGTLPADFLARYKMHKLLGTGATSTVHLRCAARTSKAGCSLDARRRAPRVLPPRRASRESIA